MFNLLLNSSPFRIFCSGTLIMHNVNKVFCCAEWTLSTVHSYIGNVGSVLHHPMKHGMASRIYFNKLFSISILSETWKREQKYFSGEPCGANCFALCVKPVHNRRPETKSVFFFKHD